jgi:hypothetical protein
VLPNDRRTFQRIRLARPILAQLDQQNALILDVGVGGAFLEHYGVMAPNQRLRLQFRWRSEDIEFVCEVARTRVVRDAGANVLSHSGVRFVEPVGDSEARLHDMIATFVGKLLAAQKINATGINHADSDVTLSELGGARRSRVRGLISYHLQPDGTWRRAATKDPRQPEDGFTVAAYEDDEDLEVLCRAYEAADDEGRRLIRLVAELSVRTVALG